ncbi:MAG: polysaccharide lyase 8 family protein [Pirellulales bacterium]|nr:polysaccharide lyase 8 family protein [Pirellulales bacterium]
MATVGRADDPDLRILHDRLLQMSILGDVDAVAVRSVIESLQADGSWADIDYEDPALSGWQPIGHVARILDMARAYRRSDSPLRGDEKLRKAMYAAYDFWNRKNPICRNWFSNQIGVPRMMLQILFLLEPELLPERMNAGLKILNRASIRATGQNLVWLAQITAARACLIGDAELCAKAYRAIADVICITDKEGIQPDLSFHQHGEQLYNGGYGLAFSNDCARIAGLLEGTRFAFPHEKIELLSRYVLDGQQWMFRGLQMDYSVHGRGISRADLTSNGMVACCEEMAKRDTPDRAKFLAFLRTLTGEDPPGAALVGNKHFWRSDLMVHRRPAYNASVRMPSARLKRTEVVNRENLKGDHLSDGLTYTYLRGDEYTNIFPLWDWRKLPGTTCLQGDRPFAPGGRGVRTFVGGVSDGSYGCAACNFENDGLTARKAWFFFDREYVCLGADINCADEHEVATCVNQCLLQGEVVVRDAGGKKTIPISRQAFDGARWVHHDGVGYVFPGNQSIHLVAETRKGTWREINGFQKTDEISGDVFCLWIDHGVKPAAKSYEYVVVPGIAAAEMDRRLKRPQIEVLGNSPEMQAVRHPALGITQIAFYQPGKLATSATRIACDSKCLVIVREQGDKVRLAVANPKNQPLDVALELNREFRGEGCLWDAAKGVTRIRLALPGGDLAGSSVVRDLSMPAERMSGKKLAARPFAEPSSDAN